MFSWKNKIHVGKKANIYNLISSSWMSAIWYNACVKQKIQLNNYNVRALLFHSPSSKIIQIWVVQDLMKEPIESEPYHMWLELFDDIYKNSIFTNGNSHWFLFNYFSWLFLIFSLFLWFLQYPYFLGDQPTNNHSNEPQ